MSSTPHVLIIGGGIGGLTLAQFLRKKGISFEVFERSPVARIQGWAIALHGVLDEVKASVPDDMGPLELVSHLLPWDLPPEIIFHTPLSQHPTRVGVRGDGSGRLIRASRPKLREWLSLNIPIHYGKQAVRVEEGPSAVTVYFSDGSSATGDIVVGADGCQSAIRKHLLGGQDVLKTEPIVVFDGEVTLSGEDMVRQLELGHSAYSVDTTDENGVRGQLFAGLGYVNPDGKSALFYFHLMAHDKEAAEPGHWTETASKEELFAAAMKMTERLPDKYNAIIKKTTIQGMRERPIKFHSLIIDQLPESRVTLLGDAAHCMTPFRGEGGVHAIRDALNLAQTLLKVDKGNTEQLKSQLGSYQREMLARGAEAVERSRAVFALDRTKADSPRTRIIFGVKAEPLPEEPIFLHQLAASA
ncbi:putative monooxygenase [Thozetella sp. PMI_491]|nr:putative monooxygenase [Thozetella sp. PMI_491]